MINSPELEALIARACDPRTGDRLVGPGSAHVTEVTAVIPLEGIGHASPDLDCSIRYSLTGCATETTIFLRAYQWMARVAIEGGDTFHAVEDDEE